MPDVTQLVSKHFEAGWKMGNFVKPTECLKYFLYLLSNGRSPNMISNNISFFQLVFDRTSKRLNAQFGQFLASGVDEVSQIAKKVLAGGAFANLDNFLANIKLGGVNHALEVDCAEIMVELKKSMSVGIFTNSPGSKTIVDRAKTVRTNEKPKVPGYCAKMGKNHKEFIGDFLFITVYRPDLYGELREIFKVCVQKFKDNRGYAPKAMYFYCANLNDEQFDNALRYIIPLIKQVIHKVHGSDIPLGLLGVQKANNVRIFPNKLPVSGKDHRFNVPH